ncbi:hypothetical protein PUF88_00715 [Lactobacillaceae bacterium L1_55_11]|nr:hypothetical protein [Lactobacillaceae bacterium L1_55_11]
MTKYYVIAHSDAHGSLPDRDQSTLKNLIPSQQLADWQEVNQLSTAFFQGKKWAKTITDNDACVLVLADSTVFSQFLNGVLSVRRSDKLPIIQVDPGAKPSLASVTDALSAALTDGQPTSRPLLVITGDVPHRITRFVVSDLTIVSKAASDNLTTSNDGGGLWQLLKRLWHLFQTSDGPVTFPVNISLDRRYLTYRQLYRFSLINDEKDGQIQAKLVEQQDIWPMIKTYFNRLLKREKHPYQNETTVDLGSQAKVHIADIETARADGNLLGTGTFSFTVKTGTYPLAIKKADA